MRRVLILLLFWSMSVFSAPGAQAFHGMTTAQLTPAAPSHQQTECPACPDMDGMFGHVFCPHAAICLSYAMADATSFGLSQSAHRAKFPHWTGAPRMSRAPKLDLPPPRIVSEIT